MKISFIGSGYVGLVSGACMANFGHDVICMDTDNKKIEDLKKCKIPIFEHGLSELIKKNINEERISFSSNIHQTVSNSDIIFISVGTPSDKNGNVDLKYVFDAIKNIVNHIDTYKVIVIKSTVPPGTAFKIKKYIKDLKLNNDLYDIVSNPEFLREGSAIKDFMIPDRIVIGSNSKKAINLVKKIYDPLFLRDIPLIKTSHETAELIKYSTNAFLATKISFINEIGLLCNKLNADVKTISNSLGLDGRISPKFLHPGPGFGGSCFPKDVLGLLKIMNEYELSGNIVDAVLKTNFEQKKYIFEIFYRLLNNNVKNKKISVLGLSFKPNTDDIRESPALVIIKKLLSKGADVYGYDPEASANMKELFPEVKFSNDLQTVLSNSDGAILLTEWNDLRTLNPKKIKKIMKTNIFMDCRNIYKPSEWINEGFKFKNIGRIE